MLKVLFALFVLSTTVASAADNDLCICQTGTEPRSQVGFFKMGCKMWNMGQSCSKKMTASLDRPLEEILAVHPEAKKIRVGYVGHWSSASATVSYLRDSVVPAVKKSDVSFSIDNTACLATDNPYIILNYLKTIPEEASRIEFRGNQAVSTGMWDKVFEGKNNFWAKVSGENLEVTFPECKSFENKVCSQQFQGGGTGVCSDEEAGSHVFLRCDEKEVWVTRMDPGGKRTERVKVRKGFWKRMELEFQVKASPYYATVEEKQNRGRYNYFFFQKEAEATDFVSQITNDVRVLLMKAAEARN